MRNLNRMIHLIPTKHESEDANTTWTLKKSSMTSLDGIENEFSDPWISRIKRGEREGQSDGQMNEIVLFLKLERTKLDENVLLKMEGAADGGQESRNYPEKFKAKRTIKRDLGRGWDYLPSKLNNGTLTFAIFALFSFGGSTLQFSEFFSKKISYLLIMIRELLISSTSFFFMKIVSEFYLFLKQTNDIHF